jgi:replication factor C subunit 1
VSRILRRELTRSKVTGAPSGKTSYVVVGEGAGASKMSKLKEKNIPTLDEDGFLNLIAQSSGPELDDKQLKAKAKEEKKIMQAALEMEKREKDEAALAKRAQKALKDTNERQP